MATFWLNRQFFKRFERIDSINSKKERIFYFLPKMAAQLKLFCMVMKKKVKQKKEGKIDFIKYS